MSHAQGMRDDRSEVIPAVLGILGLAGILQWDVSSRQLLLFIIATALGVSLFHAAFGFAGVLPGVTVHGAYAPASLLS